ncbi:ParB/RepB/Spo0J family partition protein [Streptomyces cylindrosporus]|uniref:ParB N-terminal domain-containing protein n=1 Tax=Streptomyces cylindrosporus TaxID=2927583 RepID=A0ABS9YR14_9ACTN|nr:ParB N-terminal domain-containing protein [Streptomyces cylindrosporus]MCI3279176.1 ParB N-terminal domain-containing protein [Streptomyces cylindrosporus]
MGRRTSLASLAGAPVEDVPGQSQPLLLSLPLDKMVPTRFNPRRRFGTDDELREFGTKLAKEQLQPAVVVSRTAYLKLWPEEAEHVGDASYVIANGERRWRASRLADRPTLEVVHKEDVASSRAAFLDAVQAENNDRQDLDPIERALGIDIMVRELGGAEQVAVYYNKTKGWVSQQRKLLKLTPELQDLVASGVMPVRVARDIAGLPAEVQSVAWDEELAKRKAAKEAAEQWKTDGAPDEATAERPGRVSAEPRFTAVNQGLPTPVPADANGTALPDRFTAVNRQGDTAPSETAMPAAPEAPAGVPEQRLDLAGQDSEEDQEQADPPPAEPSGERKPVMFPYTDGALAARLLIQRMPRGEFDTMVDLLAEHRAQQQAVAG